MKREFIKEDPCIEEVDKEFVDKLLDSCYKEGYDPEGYRPKGRFLLHEPKRFVNPDWTMTYVDNWTAIDNEDGCAWTEDFVSRDVAILWLNGKVDSEGYPLLDSELDNEDVQKYLAGLKKEGHTAESGWKEAKNED